LPIAGPLSVLDAPADAFAPFDPLAALEAHEDAVAACDGEWRFVYSNAAAERLLGSPRAELLGQCVWDLYPRMVGGATHTALLGVRETGEPAAWEGVSRVLQRRVRMRAVRQGPHVLVFARDVTDCRSAEGALRERTAELECLLDAFPDLYFWIDGGGRMLRHHVGQGGRLSVEPGAFLGRTGREVFPSELGERFDAAAAEAVRTGRVVTVEYSLPGEDGDAHFEARYAPVGPDLCISIVREITARKRMDEALRCSEQRFRSLFDHAAVGVGIVALDGRFAEVNPCLAAILGYTRGELCARTVFDVTPREDWSSERETVRARLAGDDSFSFDKRYLRKDGATVWAHLSGTLVRRPGGEPDYVVAVVEDIGERKEAETRLRRSEERLARALEGSEQGLWDANLATGRVYVDDRVLRNYGFEPGTAVADPELLRARIHPDDVAQVMARVAAHLRGDEDAYRVEFRVADGQGGWRWLQDRAKVMERDAAGAPLRMAGTQADVTDRRKVDEARIRLTRILEATTDLVATADAGGRLLHVNTAGRRMLGVAPEHDVAGKPLAAWLAPEAAEAFERLAVPAALRDGSWNGETTLLTRSGRRVPVSLVLLAHRGGDGEVSFLSTIARDITALMAAERALRESEEHFRALIEHASDVVAVLEGDCTVSFVSPSVERVLGYGPEELLGAETVVLLHPDDQHRAREVMDRAVRGPGLPQAAEFRVRARNGSWRTMAAVATSLLHHPAVMGIVVNLRDVTERRQIAEALRENEERYRTVFEQSSDAIFITGRDGSVIDVNTTFLEHFGFSREELLRHGVQAVYADAGERDAFRREVETHGGVRDHPMTLRTRAGELRHCLVSSNVRRGPDGEVMGFQGIVRDVTEHRVLEEQLRQAQKMEAVGRLAGGVAHDFNNLLTAIRGNADLALMGLSDGDPLRGDLDEIRRAADRAAALTRQLLAFSRRQVLQPRALDLNEVVRGTDRMLRRLIGEDTELVCILGEGLGHVRADPGQLEQVLMNLAVNARDAMPGGGRITLRTEPARVDAATRPHPDLEPGCYAALTVSDTGQGIPQGAMAHVFEPFFTTKEVGKGTGLGLATVYGIVRQSGGCVWAGNAPGGGAVFTIYLPRTNASPAQPSANEPAGRVARGEGTVLLVEDEPQVRALTRRMLERSGYTVLTAANGEEALRLVAGHAGPLDLVLTDMVMPLMGGRELVERLAGVRPELRVVFMTGYTAGGVDTEGAPGRGLVLLEKPFSPEVLTSTIRAAMHGRPGA
jgi:two-component system cell cycle sensor histidine kinase/response regulator CckA